VVQRHRADCASTACGCLLDHLIGDEGAGFRMIMQNFNGESLLMSAGAIAFAQVCLDEALDWARQRKTFGASLVEHQVIRHKLMDMRMRIASRAPGCTPVERQEAGDTGPPSGWPTCAC
jgi:acyl-CoA dehydrogenase